MEDILKTCPQHTISWLKGGQTMYKHQGFWNAKDLIEGTVLAQQNFKAEPSDVLVASCPKTDTTWLKALAFAIVTRDKQPQELWIPTPGHAHSLHFIAASDCKIVYIYRNIKDVIVSYYYFLLEALKLSVDDAPFEIVRLLNHGGLIFRSIKWYQSYSDLSSGIRAIQIYQVVSEQEIREIVEDLKWPVNAKRQENACFETRVRRHCAGHHLECRCVRRHFAGHHLEARA
ncbi:hypothetical protein OSB04_001422 [Centaurea solstitialis]|uniref:Sulfotransferase n=1 Tax=Centaurea solstitialis TaxID=347529 RepID=A0AA38U3K1_9ASTR|nr:hypothetical protein OSB04_001422 [Centaurea solstitialis]